MSKAVAAILQVAGLAATSLGAGLMSLPAGVLVAGVALLLIGLAVER